MGKSNKEGFYIAAFWLHKDHPKTLACNIGSLSDFGYMKDLPEILYRLLEGSNVRKNQKDELNKRKTGKKSSSSLSRGVQDEWNQQKTRKMSRSSLSMECI